LKYYLALALYHFGDGISRLVEKFDWYWLHPLYTKVMLLSGDLDTENRIWQREPYMAGGKCRYSTNWMGVANLNWYIERGLTKKKTITFTEDSLTVKHGKNKPGDTIEVDEPTVYYSCGRIDVRGGDTDIYYGDEIGVPPMRSEDWGRFSDWLDTVETDFMWTLDQLVEMYERKNPKIRWADNEQKN
jgi:hypothetical protein